MVAQGRLADGTYYSSKPWLIARVEKLEDEVEQLKAIIKQCEQHLDGCSHGVSDELWDLVATVLKDK